MMKSALVSAGGIGDGLLMMVAHRALETLGDVTHFHARYDLLAPLFEGAKMAPHPDSIDALTSFDLIVLENDNSERAWEIMRARDRFKKLIVLFPTPCKMMRDGDVLFSPKKPFASNLVEAMMHLVGRPLSKDNGIKRPQGLYKKHPKRICIHPTSADVKRNWHPMQYLKLAQRLSSEGLTPSFTVGADEHSYWRFVEDEGFELPHFNALDETAHHIFESGFLIGNDSALGHLASNLAIPTLTISGNPKRVALWRPDFAENTVVTLKVPLPNFKGINLRVRENFWQPCISVGRVMRSFKKAYAQSCAAPR